MLCARMLRQQLSETSLPPLPLFKNDIFLTVLFIAFSKNGISLDLLFNVWMQPTCCYFQFHIFMKVHKNLYIIW